MARKDGGAEKDVGVGAARPGPIDLVGFHRALLESMREGVSLSTAGGIIVYTNPAEDEMFGYRPGELVGQHVSVQNAYAPEENARIVERTIADLEANGFWRGEWHNRRKDGSSFFTTCRITAVYLDGKPHWLCVREDITGERATALALRESEARLALAASAGNVGIWDWDVLTGQMIYSPEARSISGFSPDQEIRIEDVRHIVHPEDHPFTSEQARRALDPQIRDRSPYEYRLVRPDGAVRWVLAQGEAVFALVNGQERAVRYLGTIQDVTERKKLEEEREAAVKRLQLAVDAGRMALWELDLVADRLTPSPELGRVLGFPEGVTPTLEQIRAGFPPDERERLQALAREQFARGERHIEAEFRYQSPAGSPLCFLLRYEALLDNDCRPVWAVGVIMDITERKLAEEQLRESEARLVTLVTSLPVGVTFLGPDGEVLLANPAYRKFVPGDRTPSKTPGSEDIWVAHDEHGRQLTRDRFPAARALRGESVPGVDFLHRGSNVDCWARVSAVPLFDESGAVSGAICVIVDIHAEKTAIAELERLNQNLETHIAERTAELMQAEHALRQAQKMEAIGHLTGGIAHDFNNLLAAMVGSLDMLRRKSDLDERARRYVENAFTAAERGAKLTAQLLAFSRSQKPELRPLNVREVIDGMSDLLSRTLGPMVRLNFQHDDPVNVLADPTQLEMAILNLAINGRDAMPDGGHLDIANRSVRVDNDPELSPGQYVEISVRDTGVGMAAEIRDRALDPFFTTKGVGKGTGLGLSQAYAMARQAGGTLRIESSPGAGTAVRMLLRATDGSGETLADIEERTTANGDVGMSVLVVEDDPEVRRFLVDSLQTLGFETRESDGGESAFLILQSWTPDIVLIDFAMPGMNGAEVAEIIRKSMPELPILFMSGYPDTGAIEAVCGKDAAVLRKPFRVADLLSAIGALSKLT